MSSSIDINQNNSPRNLFAELLKKRDEQREDVNNAPPIIYGDELPLELNQMGYYRWYLHPGIKNQGNRSSLFWVQEIPPLSSSGKLKSGGGQIFIIWQGNGYSMVNDVKYEWGQYDALYIPIIHGGSTYKHFNSDADNWAKIICCEPVYIDSMGVDKASGFEVLENSPDYKP